MKKTNKILTRALVILLALVLITSSVVSSTFAKYVVTKSASTEVELQKFGLTVNLKGKGTEAKVSQKGDSVTLSYSNITLIPGFDTYKDAIEASVSGKSSVPAKLKIKVEITGANDTYFTISKTNFSTLKDEQCGVYNPITFYVGGESANADDVYEPLSGTAGSIFKNNVENSIAIKMAAKANGSNAGAEVTRSIAKDEDVTTSLSNLNLGFAWLNPPNIAGIDCLDEISTWLSSSSSIPQDDTNSFTITYTISVEQDTTASN